MTVRASLRRATAKQNGGMQIDPKTGICMCDSCVESRCRQAEITAAGQRRMAQIKADSGRFMESVRNKDTSTPALLARANALIDAGRQQVAADNYDATMRRAHFDRQKAKQ
jgi:hypothetical protein